MDSKQKVGFLSSVTLHSHSLLCTAAGEVSLSVQYFDLERPLEDQALDC